MWGQAARTWQDLADEQEATAAERDAASAWFPPDPR